jgi:hypothetical protein
MFTGENRDLGCRRYRYSPWHVTDHIDDQGSGESKSLPRD